MNNKIVHIRFFDMLKNKFYHILILCYRLNKQTDKTINGLKPHFQKNKD